jgi:hypothetical protein
LCSRPTRSVANHIAQDQFYPQLKEALGIFTKNYLHRPILYSVVTLLTTPPLGKASTRKPSSKLLGLA